MRFDIRKWIELNLEELDYEAFVGTEEVYTDEMLLAHKDSKKYLDACLDMFCNIFDLDKNNITIEQVNDIFKKSSFGMTPFITKNNTPETTKETMMGDIANFMNNMKEAIKKDSVNRYLYKKDDGKYDTIENALPKDRDSDEYKEYKKITDEFNKTHSIHSNGYLKTDLNNIVDNQKKDKEMIYELLKKASEPNTSTKERVKIERRIVAFKHLKEVNEIKCYSRIALCLYDGNDNPRDWSEEKQKAVGMMIVSNITSKGRILAKNRATTDVQTIRMFMIKNGATLEEAFSDDPKYDDKWKKAAKDFMNAQINNDEKALFDAVIACHDEIAKIKIPGKESTLEEKINFFANKHELSSFLQDVLQTTGQGYKNYEKTLNELSKEDRNKYERTLEMANIFGTIKMFYKIPGMLANEKSLRLDSDFEVNKTFVPNIYFIKKYDHLLKNNSLADYDNDRILQIPDLLIPQCIDDNLDPNLSKNIMNDFYDSYIQQNDLDVEAEIKKIKEEYKKDEIYSKQMEEENVSLDDDINLPEHIIEEYSNELDNHKEEIEVPEPVFSDDIKDSIDDTVKSIEVGLEKGIGYEVFEKDSIIDETEEIKRRNESLEILTQKDINELKLNERFPPNKMVDKKAFEKAIKDIWNELSSEPDIRKRVIPDDPYKAVKKLESIIAKTATYLSNQLKLVPSKGKKTYEEFFNMARENEKVGGKIKSDYIELANKNIDEYDFEYRANDINYSLLKIFKPKDYLLETRKIKDQNRIDGLKKKLSEADNAILESGEGELSAEGKKIIALPEKEIKKRQDEDKRYKNNPKESVRDIVRGVLLVKDLERVHASRSLWTRIVQWFNGNVENKAIENIKNTLYNSHIGKKGIDAALKCNNEFDILKSVTKSTHDFFEANDAIKSRDKRYRLWNEYDGDINEDLIDNLEEMANKNLEDYYEPYYDYSDKAKEEKDKVENSLENDIVPFFPDDGAEEKVEQEEVDDMYFEDGVEEETLSEEENQKKIINVELADEEEKENDLGI